MAKDERFYLIFALGKHGVILAQRYAQTAVRARFVGLNFKRKYKSAEIKAFWFSKNKELKNPTKCFVFNLSSRRSIQGISLKEGRGGVG